MIQQRLDGGLSARYTSCKQTPEAENMNLKELVVGYRTEHDLSQREFAAQCGLSNGYIRILENEIDPCTGNKITPTLTALYKLAAGMNMTLIELITVVDDLGINQDIPLPDAQIDPCVVDEEIAAILDVLSDWKKQQALKFLRFLVIEAEY